MGSNMIIIYRKYFLRFKVKIRKTFKDILKIIKKKFAKS